MRFATAARAAELLDLTPLIDVVFLLLIFFMVTTSFVRDAASIPLDLPAADASAEPAASRDVVVQIDADGQLFVDDEPVDDDGLARALAATAADGSDATVVLRADRRIDHGRVVGVMDAARRAGLSRIAVATERPTAVP